MSERLQATARRLRALTTWHPMTEKPKKPGLYLLAVEHIDGEIGVREARFFGITWQYGNLKQHGWREKPDYEPTEGG